MSGFEIVGVVFGVLPILIETIKAYANVTRTFRTFCRHSRELRTVQVQFKCNRGIFLNECRLLLCLIEDGRGADDMLKDEEDHRWKSKQANDKLNEILRDNFDLCQTIIEASRELLDEMKVELQKFDAVVGGKDKSGSIKSNFHQLREAARICLDKSKYEKILTSLRDRTSELTQLRAQIGQFQQQRTYSDSLCTSRRALPSCISSIQTASRKLHEALSEAWCCGDLRHENHFAKICLDAQVEELGVRLDLTISCQQAIQQPIDRVVTELPIWMYVQSISIDAALCSTTELETQTVLEETSSGLNSPSTVSSGRKKRTISDVAHTLPCKKDRNRRVRFLDTNPQSGGISFAGSSTTAVSNAISQIVAHQATSEINLCQTKNICHYLKQNLQLCGETLTKHCVGYLESPQMYRHNFYLQKRDLSADKGQEKGLKSSETTIISILDLMGQSVNDTLTLDNQLRLAHKIALAILQFNSTPWLAQRWRFKDLSYFGSHDKFDEESLKTLHFSSQISSVKMPDTASMEGVEEVMEAFSEEDYFGINNTTLFFLGVALLEVAHWKPLESLGNPQDPNAILTARRLASRPGPLGPRYDGLVRKCLQCNFGFGTDLSNKELQTAVYGDVVCPLEKMMEALSL